jgi:hypothetical protein
VVQSSQRRDGTHDTEDPEAYLEVELRGTAHDDVREQQVCNERYTMVVLCRQVDR